MEEQIKLVNESIRELKHLRNVKKQVFRDVPPVLWFGNITTLKSKVLVLSANPSRPDQPVGKARIPSADKWNKEIVTTDDLIRDYNNYFQNDNRAINWFGDKPMEGRNDDQQGRIEDFLNGMGASFYDDNNYQPAIHIDLLPFSTEKPFTHVIDEILSIDGVPEWIDAHVRSLIRIIKPNIVIINGISNFNCFNLCVNVGAQPYTPYSYGNTTIWRSAKQDNFPTIIGVSMNMGSSCRKKRKELIDLGKYVKKLLTGTNK